jgi:hypothetical protein
MDDLGMKPAALLLDGLKWMWGKGDNNYGKDKKVVP